MALFCRSFDTKEGEWQDVDLPFKAFIPVFRAKSKPDAEPLNSASVTSIQAINGQLKSACQDS